MDYNIGVFGFVDNGKSSFVENLTGKPVDLHSIEKSKGMTIKLNYSDFYLGYTQNYVIQNNPENSLHKFHIVDTPGHQILFTKMLTSLSLVDLPILIISCYKSQANLNRLDKFLKLLVHFNKIIIVITKIDKISKLEFSKFLNELKLFLKDWDLNYIILPFSKFWQGYKKYFAEQLFKYTEKYKPEINSNLELLFLNFKSYNINRSKLKLQEIKPGILGGRLKNGKIIKGQDIYINYILYNGKWISLKTKVIKILQSQKELQVISNSGFCTIETDLDPSIFSGDKLSETIVTSKDCNKINKFELKIIQDLDKTIRLDSNSQISVCILNLRSIARIIKIKNKVLSIITEKPLPDPILNQDFKISCKISQQWFIKCICQTI
jgi:small GTP-binding protein